MNGRDRPEQFFDWKLSPEEYPIFKAQYTVVCKKAPPLKNEISFFNNKYPGCQSHPERRKICQTGTFQFISSDISRSPLQYKRCEITFILLVRHDGRYSIFAPVRGIWGFGDLAHFCLSMYVDSIEIWKVYFFVR